MKPSKLVSRLRRARLLCSMACIGAIGVVDPAASQTIGHTLQAQFVAGGKFPYHINVYFSPIGQYFDYLTGAKGLNGKIGEWSNDNPNLQARWTLSDTTIVHETRNRRDRRVVLTTTYAVADGGRCIITQSGVAAQPLNVTTCLIIKGHVQR